MSLINGTFGVLAVANIFSGANAYIISKGIYQEYRKLLVVSLVIIIFILAFMTVLSLRMYSNDGFVINIIVSIILTIIWSVIYTFGFYYPINRLGK